VVRLSSHTTIKTEWHAARLISGKLSRSAPHNKHLVSSLWNIRPSHLCTLAQSNAMTHNREPSVGGGQQRVQRDTEAEKSGKKIKSRSPLAWKMKSLLATQKSVAPRSNNTDRILYRREINNVWMRVCETNWDSLCSVIIAFCLYTFWCSAARTSLETLSILLVFLVLHIFLVTAFSNVIIHEMCVYDVHLPRGFYFPCTSTVQCFGLVNQTVEKVEQNR
jgi:hypothetical protein